MQEIIMYTRLAKIALVWSFAFFVTLVVLNNLTDYHSNYQFVSHVLKMDTTFPDNKLMWRSIDSMAVYHAAYGIIILIEALVAILCWLGGFHLLRSIHDATQFEQAKSIATIGLTLGIILWFLGFMGIGGEWFLMWQSKVWNGNQSAFRITVVIGIILMFLNQADH